MRRLVFAAIAAAAGTAFGTLVLAEGLKEAWPPNLNSAFHVSLGAVLLAQAGCLAVLAWNARRAWAGFGYGAAGAVLSLATAFGSEIFGPLALAVFMVATGFLVRRAAMTSAPVAQRGDVTTRPAA